MESLAVFASVFRQAICNICYGNLDIRKFFVKFWELIDYIKKDGCNIRMYNKSELKVAQCSGTFDITKKGNPLICLAMKGHTRKELLQLLLHEYAHFLQWKEGMLHKLEGADLKEGWDVLDFWLQHKKKYTTEQLKKARDAVLLIEYDADIRVTELSVELGIDIGSHQAHMANAYSYILLIKWAAKNRKWGGHPDGSGLDGRVRTPEEILVEITPEEEEMLDECLA